MKSEICPNQQQKTIVPPSPAGKTEKSQQISHIVNHLRAISPKQRACLFLVDNSKK